MRRVCINLYPTGRVICTCYAGFRFNQELHRQSSQRRSYNLDAPTNSVDTTNQTMPVGVVKACEDIDECTAGKDDCQQVYFSNVNLSDIAILYSTSGVLSWGHIV